MMKVALLEASHWHVPLYLDALEAEDIHVVAVSDAEHASGSEIAKRFSARPYESYEKLLHNEAVDFAFAFGRHCEMARMGRMLLAHNIPFAIEKPCGMNAAEVRQLRQMARDKNIFVAIPFIFRFSELLQSLEKLNEPSPVNWNHMSFRFIAGSLERYKSANCAWMLDKKQAAGGCAINLAVHFIDLILELVGEKITTVSAQMIESSGLANVEVFSSMTLATESGKVCGIETGYTYPQGTDEQREFSFTLASEEFYIRSKRDGIQIVPHDGSGQQTLALQLNTDEYYPVFVRETLKAFQKGANPVASLLDMERVMNVIDAAYESASQRGKPVVCRSMI